MRRIISADSHTPEPPDSTSEARDEVRGYLKTRIWHGLIDEEASILVVPERVDQVVLGLGLPAHDFGGCEDGSDARCSLRRRRAGGSGQTRVRQCDEALRVVVAAVIEETHLDIGNDGLEGYA